MFEGKRVALVATGGGSRAIAHIGVISACEEIGIKIDTIIGASAGAIIGAYYSQHLDLDKLIDHCRPTLLRKYNFERFGWHQMISIKNFFSSSIVRGIFDLSHAEAFLHRTLEADNFNQLKIPIFVAATNLSDHSGVLFGPGNMDYIPVSKTVVASCCIPILFRPVEIEGKYYIDGEIKRPLSIDAAIERGADVVIVSDTYSAKTNKNSNSGMLEIASEVVNMMFEDKSIRGIDISKQKYPDKDIILVSPKVNNIPIFRPYSYETLIRSGYDAAMEAFQEVKDGMGNT